MKKFIFSLAAIIMMAVSASAQTTNVYSHAKAFDNMNGTFQGGVLTTMPKFFSGHTACAPIIVLGVDKYITPVIGVGIEGRALIGTGEVNVARFNSKTAFDAVNVSGYLKANLANIKLFMPDGGYKYGRNWFEPVIYTGLGWGHSTSSDCASMGINYEQQYQGIPTEMYGSTMRNRMTYRAGVELNFNLGKSRDFGIVVNPSVVWGNIDNGRLCKQNGQFEVTAGIVYHFKTSNGTNHFAEPAPVVTTVTKEVVKEVVREKPVGDRRPHFDNTYAVTFAQNSAELSSEAKAILDRVPANATVNVAGSTSPEGTTARNTELALQRAQSVAEYLKGRGVTVNSVEGGEAGRAAIVTLQRK